MKGLKTLGEFDEERWDAHNKMQELNNPHPNGIACPKCGKELWDSYPMTTLTSNPPQKNIHCPACGYRGYRLA